MPPRIAVQKIKLPNKAVVLVEENHATPIVSCCAYFLGGIRGESEKQNGVSYFTQKLLLKGSKRYTADELAFRTEAIGNSINFFTEKDAIGSSSSVLSKHFEEALDLYFETLFQPIFPEEEVEKEREVIIAEIEESRDEVYTHCLQLCDKTLFTQHPYRFPKKGEIESVKNLKREDLIAWHHQWFQPNNLVFSVVGDISAERVAEQVVKYLEQLPKGKVPKLPVQVESGYGKREISTELEKRQLAISLGFLAPSALQEERFPFEVMNGLLSGMGARLFIELRDKRGLAYSVGSRYDVDLDYGILKTYMGTAAEQENAAKEGLLEELMKLRYSVPDEEELSRTKHHLIGLYQIRKQKNSTQAVRYARYESLGLGWRVANQYPKKVEAVQAEAVREMAKRYIDPENYSCAIVRPALRTVEP